MAVSLFGGDSARSADAFPAGAEEKVTFVVDVEKDATPGRMWRRRTTTGRSESGPLFLFPLFR